MPERVHTVPLPADQVAHQAALDRASNGLRYTTWGETKVEPAELAHMVSAVPDAIGAALARTAWYFVPLAISARENSGTGHRSTAPDATLVAPNSTEELAEQAICHRNVSFRETDGVFISTRLLPDRFALSFEFFINVGHAFVDSAGVPESFTELVWAQALADVRGETSQDAWESRLEAFENRTARSGDLLQVNEKARLSYLEAAFSDSIAIYLLSLTLDFNYSELREREYPLLAPQSLAERLRAINTLFPPNAGYEFAIRYRRRA